MRRTTLRLTIAALTFAVGVTASVFWIAYRTPVVVTLKAPETDSCFPGLALSKDAILTSPQNYFPPNVFSNNQWQDDFTVKWYSKHLAAMNEPSLLNKSNAIERYRFLWLRSFHHPVAVRLERLNDQKLLILKQLSGRGGYEPGNLVVNRTRVLTEREWSEFKRLLEQCCYWQMPAQRFDEASGEDGAQWIFEGARDGRYHIVDRWSPRDTDYRKFCLYFLKISGLGIDEHSKDLY